MVNSFHIPVLTQEILNYLNLKKGGVYIDCTLGGGGHSEAILENIYPHGFLIGIDQDIEAIETAKEELKSSKKNELMYMPVILLIPVCLRY